MHLFLILLFEDLSALRQNPPWPWIIVTSLIGLLVTGPSLSATNRW